MGKVSCFCIILSQITDCFTALRSYVGFFSLIWFTWFQVALFDIRFGNDSAFERVCKAIQFGVMVGLAVESAAFTFEDFDENKGVFQAISLLLMVRRLVLALQDLASWWWLRSYKRAHLPILIHFAMLPVSRFVLLGLSFAFVG